MLQEYALLAIETQYAKVLHAGYQRNVQQHMKETGDMLQVIFPSSNSSLIYRPIYDVLISLYFPDPKSDVGDRRLPTILHCYTICVYLTHLSPIFYPPGS